MKQAYVYDWHNQMRYPFFYEDRGPKMALNWGYLPGDLWKNTKDDVKGCEGSAYHPDEKLWTVDHPSKSQRNRNVLGWITDGTIPGTTAKPFQKYFDPHPEQYAGVLDKFGVDFRPYQAEDIPWLLSIKRGILGYDMGLGKTLMGITCMQVFKNAIQLTPGATHSPLDRDNFWVIAPRAPLNAWQYELRRWDKFNVQPQLIMNSHQAIARAMTQAPHPPLGLVVDESANFKNPLAQRTKLLFELSNLMSRYYKGQELLLLMTGTPLPKDTSDFHAQLEILAPGYIREKSPAQLRSRLAHMKEMEGPHGTYKKLMGWKTDELEAFAKRIAPLVRRRLKKDVEKDLPAIIFIERVLTPDPGVLAAARMACESLSGIQALAAIRQLSDGFQYDKEYVENDEGIFVSKRVGTTLIPTPKDDALRDELDELDVNEETRVVIWAGFQASIDRVTRICCEKGWAVLQADGRGVQCFAPDSESKEAYWMPKSDIQTQFQDLNLDLKLAFVGNPDAAGEGLTLTQAHTAIYYSNTFKGDKRLQSQDRIHRIGMDKNIAPRIIDFIHLPTDKLVLNNLKLKKNLQAISTGELLDALTKADLEKNK